MSLIECVECKREVSSQAKVCPHCGCPKPGGQGTGGLQNFISKIDTFCQRWSHIPKKYPYLLVAGLGMMSVGIMQFNDDKEGRHITFDVIVIVTGFLLFLVMAFLRVMPSPDEQEAGKSMDESKTRPKNGGE